MKKKPKKHNEIIKGINDGDGIQAQTHFYMSCCGCGLRHVYVLYEVNKKGNHIALTHPVVLRVFSDDGGTEMNRRYGKFKKLKDGQDE